MALAAALEVGKQEVAQRVRAEHVGVHDDEGRVVGAVVGDERLQEYEPREE